MRGKVKEESMVVSDNVWRFKLGIILFVLSIIVPVAGVPLAVSLLELSTTMIASVTEGILLIGEVIGFLAIAVMGKPGYLYIKEQFFLF